MPISMTCPGCKAAFRLPDELAGKSARCQRCGYRFEVPLNAGPQGSTILYERPADALAEAVTQGPPQLVLPIPSDLVEDDGSEQPRKTCPKPKRPSAPPRGGMFWVVLTIGGVLVIGSVALVVAVWYRAGNQVPIVGPAFPPAVKMAPVKVAPAAPSVRKLPPVGPDDAATVTGTLKPTDPLGPDNRRGQSYAINFEAGQTYVIDQRSKKFDAHLYLFDDNAKLVAQNDDFQGLDSRIRYTAPRGGTYTILAGTHNGALGDYTLVVRVERPAPPPHPRRVRIG